MSSRSKQRKHRDTHTAQQNRTAQLGTNVTGKVTFAFLTSIHTMASTGQQYLPSSSKSMPRLGEFSDSNKLSNSARLLDACVMGLIIFEPPPPTPVDEDEESMLFPAWLPERSAELACETPLALLVIAPPPVLAADGALTPLVGAGAAASEVEAGGIMTCKSCSRASGRRGG